MDIHEQPMSKPADEDDGNPKFGRLLAVLVLALVLFVVFVGLLQRSAVDMQRVLTGSSPGP
jgi:hypothetical protein